MPLGRGVTAIIGPNGSGKSNITDAVLFALGEGSPSLLRANLMSDLIFSGSESLAPAGVADVTLVLDNSEGTISLPYEEVSLTRRISREGETEYRINGVRARLTDVRAVAGEAGLGRHSILRQGAVDAIVSGGAAACRTALEEAAGLGVFRRRRLAASRKLERAAARLQSGRQAEADLSAQLRRIEAEAVAARRYRKLEARYRELSLAHLYKIAVRETGGVHERLADLQRAADTLRERQEALRERGERLEAEEKELEEQVRAMEGTIRHLEEGSEALRVEALGAERALLRLESSVQDGGADRPRLISRLEDRLDEVASSIIRLEEVVVGAEEEHLRKQAIFGRLEEHVAQGRKKHSAAVERKVWLAGEREALRERRERVVGRLLNDKHSLDEGDLELLAEMEEKLAACTPERLRARGRAALVRLKELRSLAAIRADDVYRRHGVLASLIGRTEAEIRALRSLGETGEGRRLCEVLRPRPGYEAAVGAALEDLAGGVLVENLSEGIKFLAGNRKERVVVRLDAERVPDNESSLGKSLLDCVEVLDPSYAEALRRLLGGIYVLEEADRRAPENGYDVAVTREGLHLTRRSVSRRAPDSNFVRRARLAEEEKRLEALKIGLGEGLYDLRETVSYIHERLDLSSTEVETLASLASRTARATRILSCEARRQKRRAKSTREQRALDEAELRNIEAEITATEDELRSAQETEERAKEKLDADILAAESAYIKAREASERLLRAHDGLQDAREHQAQISRRLAGLKDATKTSEVGRMYLARCAVEHVRRLDGASRRRLIQLRHARSDAARLQSRAAERYGEITRETSEAAGRLTKTVSEAALLRDKISRAEEAQKAAESEIIEEWGASLEIARRAAETLSRDTDVEYERAHLARTLKNFGDVNLLAISQEGQLRERYDFVAGQRSDAEAAAAKVEHIIQSIDKDIEVRFEIIFQKARQAFAEIVPRMMDGATGELWLSEEGVEIGLRLKGRGWRPLRVLSGGERSLLALSFLFSVFLGRFKDSLAPFYMLDEAEAALDDLNLARFLAVINSYRSEGQFLLVTHQKRTMAAADVLYGVTQDPTGATVLVSKHLTGE
ncbi:MAG: AAA family ATPase [Actinomycetota bacterium]|nr:AAA family ATPase [Actinomycetota bacterium]